MYIFHFGQGFVKSFLEPSINLWDLEFIKQDRIYLFSLFIYLRKLIHFELELNLNFLRDGLEEGGMLNGLRNNPI